MVSTMSLDSMKDQSLPLISIIISVYNQAHFLARAIDSVLQQNHPNTEIIVVNDGSRDPVDGVMNQYIGMENIIYIKQENKGLPAARNVGFSKSQGAYINFLDSDDYFHPHKLTKQLNILTKHPGVSFVYCDIHEIDSTAKRTKHNISDNPGPLSGNIFGTLFRGGYFPPHTALLRRTILEQHGLFHENLGGHADFELWLRLSACGCKAYFLNESLAYYQRSEHSMSHDLRHMHDTLVAAYQTILEGYPALCASELGNIQSDLDELRKINIQLCSEVVKLNENIVQLQSTSPVIKLLALLFGPTGFPGPNKLRRLYRNYRHHK